ncbi:hypothetical protein Pcinc_026051 [Petrolisthes cinctipes]|uniref:WDR36/Utp21 C-terminal domain-containing protein n=1 Tax=Petrolisthes cinctipes TaxID=88211 RepID=A0AAE1F6U1_PETCI|nr:hypothetical protein Pcinc_026051 [Petrolisthes cinctipes]
MVTGSEIGHLALWDLKERKLLSQVRFVHRGLVAGLECLPGEPLMITSSPDNSLKMWIFDLPDGGARLLKLVEGHSAPPLCARFYGSTKVLGDNVITAGEDSSVMCFSTVADINKNFGFASYNRKSFKRLNDKTQIMPAITRFAFETTKERIWDGAAAIHYGHSLVTTWSFYSQTMGEHKLQHERFKEETYRHCVATCLDLTACGNFVIIGYDSGHIDKYNMQSGQHRGSFGNPVAHVGGVQDLAADGINMFVVSGGQEGDLKWWRMRDSSCIKTLSLDESISKMFLHRDSGLLGVALEDWSIQVVDVDTKCVVRKLYGHHNQLTDIAFSPDSKWLISSSMDKTIRTWDIPSGACVDCFAVPIPCTSIAVSPSGDFLATVHTDQLGVYLWSNKALFHHLSLRPLTSDHQAATVCLPSAGAAEFQVAEAEETVEDTKDEDEEYISPQQISEELITLAMLPTSRWLNLLSLDVIRKRNKPIEPPKVPKSAPFFIPTVPGLEFKFAPTETEKSATNSKVKPVKSFEVLTDFGKKLKAGEYESALKMLMDQGPSGVEVEIRGLDPDVGGSEEVMIQFLEMVRWALTMQCNFEAVQGYLGLFLKLHANYIMDNSAVSEKCEELYAVQGKAWHKIRDSMDQTLSLVSYFKNAALISY